MVLGFKVKKYGIIALCQKFTGANNLTLGIRLQTCKIEKHTQKAIYVGVQYHDEGCQFLAASKWFQNVFPDFQIFLDVLVVELSMYMARRGLNKKTTMIINLSPWNQLIFKYHLGLKYKNGDKGQKFPMTIMATTMKNTHKNRDESHKTKN